MARDRTPKFATEIAYELNNDEVEAYVASAKVAASTVMKICAAGIRALQPVILDPDKGPAPGTFAVDKHYRLYVCRTAVPKWVEMAKAVSKANPCQTCGATEHHPIAYVGGAICHEVCHPLREHFSRGKDIDVTNHKLWNIAIDEEINDDLLEIFKFCDMPRLCLPHTHLHLPHMYEHDDGKLAEHYYYKLLESEGDRPEFGMDHGSAADGQSKPWDLGEPTEGSPGISEAEGRMIRKNVAKDIKKASKSRGTVPGGWERWADGQLEGPKYDWRAELNQAIRWSIARTKGEEERTYRRLNRRCVSLDYKVILPTTYDPKPVVAIVQDTSGSMDGEAIRMSLQEAEGIIRAVGINVSWIACDMKADKVQSVNNVNQIDIHGGGGTDMRIGIKAACESQPRPNVVVLFTDGYTPWPDAPLPFGTRLVVGLVGDHSCEINNPPAWATVVKIVGDDIVVRGE